MAGHYWVEREMAPLVQAAQAGDAEATERVMVACYELAQKSLDHYRNRTLIGPIPDAVQEAVLACLKALPNYNAERGRTFTYFRLVVRSRYSRIIRRAIERLRASGPVVSIDHDPGLQDVTRDLRVAVLYLRSRDSTSSRRPALSAERVAEVRALLAEGLTCAEVARRLDLRPPTVQRIRSGRSYREVS